MKPVSYTHLISFQTKSGQLIVKKVNDLYEMDMPAYPLTEVPVTDEMELAIGFRPLEAWLGRDLVCVMEDEQQVLQAMPNEERLKELDGLLLQLTAKGTPQLFLAKIVQTECKIK